MNTGNTLPLPDNVISVCLFGSMARKDNDPLSDADILVVVKDRSGKVPEEHINNFAKPLVGCAPTISWYGQERLQSMFRSGHLFAWHLHQESRALWGGQDITDLFGQPTAYLDAEIDIASFYTVMSGIPYALEKCPENAVYELGLLYVCVRNIAMSASWHLCKQPDFTRYSPFNILIQPPNVSRVDYELTMSCRMASQRGLAPPEGATTNHALRLHQCFQSWAKNVMREVKANVRETCS